MKRNLFIALLLILLHCSAIAQDEPVTDRTCLNCHDSPTVNPILNSRHSVGPDQNCQSCHGQGKEHAEFPLELSSLRFGAKSTLAVETENAVCLTCHQKDHINWQSSTHASEDVGCASCHSIHAPHDKVMDPQMETGVCATCHLKEKIQVNKPYRHPVREGMVVCSNCHNPHGSNGPSELVSATVNETCYSCHAEKRGPFVNEHQPVQDDCMNCHTPHGSNHESLLRVRSPFLCQQCHADHSHTREAYDFEDLPGGSGSRQSRVTGSSCVNCHSEIHGSNTPGARSFRQ